MTPTDYLATLSTFALLLWWAPYFPLRQLKKGERCETHRT